MSWTSSELLFRVWDALCGGVDFDLPGNGGNSCSDHVKLSWRVSEFAIATSVSLIAIAYSRQLRRKEQRVSREVSKTAGNFQVSGFHRALFIFTTFIYGLQVGYKLSSRQVIFLLNPCHLITVACIYLLASDPWKSKWAKAVHTRVLHYQIGPILAILFPVTNTLFLPLEATTYWVQHVLDILVPYYLLMRHPGYSSDSVLRPSGILLSYGVWLLHHFTIMMWIGVWTLANVGSMLCPAITDPFPPAYYRLHGLWHQLLAIVLCAAVATAMDRLAQALGWKQRKLK